MITKGEWKAKENKDGSWVVTSGNIVIALFNRKDFPEWNESNAKAVAAIPQLLVACGEARHLLKNMIVPMGVSKVGSKPNEVLQLLVKALKDADN